MKKYINLFINNLKLVIALLSIILAVFIYSFYLNERKTTQDAKENTLKTIADFKISQISAWYVDEVLDADLISSDESLAELVSIYLKTSSHRDQIRLVRYLNQIKTEHLYYDVMLYTLDGKGLISSNGTVQAGDSLDAKYLQIAFKDGKSLNTDFFRSTLKGEIYFDFVSTVKANNNKSLAGMILRKDPDEFLNPLIKTWPTSAKTTETFLVKTASGKKSYKYQPKQASITASDCWQKVSHKDEPASKAAKGYAGIFYGHNEKGVSVCSYISPIPNTPWSIVLNINKKELYKDFKSNMTKVIIIAILVIVLCFLGISSFHRGRREKYLNDLLAKETDLRQYQERFNVTMDILGEGVCMFRADDHTIVLTNPKMDEMFGYNPGELSGINISVILSQTEKNPGEITNEFISTLDKTKVLNIDLMNFKKDGTLFWTTAHVYLLIHDKFGPVWIGVFQDITEKKNFEEKILQSEASYKNLFENNPHPMWVFDTETLRFLSVNNTAVEKYGYSVEEFLSMTMLEMIPKEDLNDFYNYTGKKEDYVRTFVSRHKLKNGEIIYVDIATHTIRYFDTKAKLVLANDVTKTLKYEADLIAAKEKAEKSERLKTAFLANMSHEIRTPLNGIIGFSQLLNEGERGKEEVKRYSGYIVEGGNRLLELLSNILNVSKIESGVEVLNPNVFFINEFLKGIFNQFLLQAKEKNIDYILNIPGETDDLQLTTDSLKLGQILTNFLSNAFKFTKVGSVEMGYECNQDEIEFYVKDSGIGIDQHQHEHIFERFYQADSSISSGHEGAGLGLAICKGFALLMNGKIRIDSTPGKGSVFFLDLPLHSVENEQTS